GRPDGAGLVDIDRAGSDRDADVAGRAVGVLARDVCDEADHAGVVQAGDVDRHAVADVDQGTGRAVGQAGRTGDAAGEADLGADARPSVALEGDDVVDAGGHAGRRAARVGGRQQG